MLSKRQILLRFPLIKLFRVSFGHEVVLLVCLTLLGSGKVSEVE